MNNPKQTLMIMGRNMVLDGLKSDKKIETVYIGKNSRNDPRIREITRLAESKKVNVSFVQQEKIRSMSGSDAAQNVIAYMQKYQDSSLREILESCLEEKKDPLILLFNSLDYEQNLGAILRTGWGAKVDAVVVNPVGVHAVTPVVAKVSHGGAAYVPLLSQSLFQAIDILKSYAVPIAGVEVNMGRSYTETPLAGPVAFLFGGEVTGISETLQKKCDTFIHIPIVEELASLNVGVATAIVIYEKRRQDREFAKSKQE